MKKRIIIISSTALAIILIITSSIIVFRSDVITYMWNEVVAALSGVDRNEKVIVGGDRKTTVFNFADKAEMTISNRIEGKEDKEIDSLKIAVKGEDTNDITVYFVCLHTMKKNLPKNTLIMRAISGNMAGRIKRRAPKSTIRIW